MTREEFILKYKPAVERQVQRFAHSFGNGHLADDMLGEAYLGLLWVADKFAGKEEEKSYISVYLWRIVRRACVRVWRQDGTISTPINVKSRFFRKTADPDFKKNRFYRKKVCGSRGLSVYTDNDEGFFWPDISADDADDLFREAHEKRIVDWSLYFSDEDAALLDKLTATYGDVSPESRNLRSKLLPKARRILARYVDG